MNIQERDEILERATIYGACCIAIGQADRTRNAKVLATERMRQAHRRLVEAIEDATEHVEPPMTNEYVL